MVCHSSSVAPRRDIGQKFQTVSDIMRLVWKIGSVRRGLALAELRRAFGFMVQVCNIDCSLLPQVTLMSSSEEMSGIRASMFLSVMADFNDHDGSRGSAPGGNGRGLPARA